MLTMASRRKRSRQRTAAEKHGLSVFETPLGWFAATWSRDRLHTLTFGYEDPGQAVEAISKLDADSEQDARPTEEMDAFAERMQAYCSGHEDDFLDVPIVLNVNTEFRRRVLQECRRIPYGHTLSYAELAAAAGSPRACRAVGNIMAHNRIPLVIPCHRVVGSHGSLGGYSARSGLTMKQRLLRLEGSEYAAR
jgi:methylated-DNA-[protein]-cysteine S-methyltransferase